MLGLCDTQCGDPAVKSGMSLLSDGARSHLPRLKQPRRVEAPLQCTELRRRSQQARVRRAPRRLRASPHRGPKAKVGMPRSQARARKAQAARVEQGHGTRRLVVGLRFQSDQQADRDLCQGRVLTGMRVACNSSRFFFLDPRRCAQRAGNVTGCQADQGCPQRRPGLVPHALVRQAGLSPPTGPAPV